MGVMLVLAAPAVVFAARFVGTDGPDRIVGTPGPDTINGRGGDDRIHGLGGNDRLQGKRGNDLVFGRGGDDHINVRDSKQDTVSCGAGIDTVIADRKDRTSSDCERIRRPGRASGGGGGRRTPPPTDIYNCDDFPLADGTTAQDYLDLYPSDPSRLDGNNDGVACEG